MYLAKLVFVKPYRSLLKNKNNSLKLISIIDELDLKNFKKDETESKKKIIEILKNIQTYLDLIWTKVNEDTIKDNFKCKWHHAAIVMDRLFLVISFIYFVASFCFIILSKKNLYRPV